MKSYGTHAKIEVNIKESIVYMTWKGKPYNVAEHMVKLSKEITVFYSK